MEKIGKIIIRFEKLTISVFTKADTRGTGQKHKNSTPAIKYSYTSNLFGQRAKTERDGDTASVTLSWADVESHRAAADLFGHLVPQFHLILERHSACGELAQPEGVKGAAEGGACLHEVENGGHDEVEGADGGDNVDEGVDDV